MSLRLASQRLTPPGLQFCASRSGYVSLLSPMNKGTTGQKRNKWSMNPFKGWESNNAKGKAATNQDILNADLEDPKKRQQFLERNMHGNVEDNIFQDEIDAAKDAQAKESSGTADQKTRENMAMVVDPDPLARVRWQRRKVIQMVRKNGRLTKDEKLRMTERQLLHKTPSLGTSVKKLVMLSRQITGKSVDDAIIQMTWSKKKMAAEVKYYLEEARDLAIAQRGMGLGKVNGELYVTPKKIQTKDGRGTLRGRSIEYRARGGMGILRHPSTSLTILLKEERTRVREHDEREVKKKTKGPWTHLPNHTISGQRPYYTW